MQKQLEEKQAVSASNLWENALKSVSNLSPKLLLAAILVAGVLARTYPMLMPSFPDPDFYYHLRMAEQAYAEGGVPQYDAFSYGGRPYTYYPAHNLLAAFFAKITGISVPYSITIITLLVALASLFTIFLLAKKLFGEKTSLGAALAAALVPGFVAKSTAFARPDEYALLFLPLAFLLALREKNNGENNNPNYFALFALFALFPLFHFTVAAICFAVFAAACLAARIGWKKIVSAGAGLTAGALYYAGRDWKEFLLAKTIIPTAETVHLDFAFVFLYSGIFILFAALALPGLVKKVVAEKKKGIEAENGGEKINGMEQMPGGFNKNNLLLAWLAAGLALVLAANRGIVFFAPPLAIAAGVGLKTALKKSEKYSKHFVVFLVAILVITTWAFLYEQKPGFGENDVEAAAWLGENSHGALAAAHWDRGHLLTFYGSRVLADGYFEFAPEPVKKISAIEEMLAAGDENRVLQLAVENGVEFVFLDEKSLAGLPENSVWRNPAVKGFEKVFDNGAQVWRLKESAA